MKRYVLFGLVLTLVLAMAVGCAPPEEGKIADGTYTAEGEADEHGWTPRVEVEILNGLIAAVDYDEVNEAGDLKSEDTEYAEAMKAVSGITPADAYEQFEIGILDTQDAYMIDAVSGATASRESFIALVNEALSE